MTKRKWEQVKWYRVNLDEAEIGLLISVLLSDRLEHGSMRYEVLVSDIKTTSDAVLAKLIEARMPNVATRLDDDGKEKKQ